MNLTQEAFTSGELSPKVLGRKSSDRYATGLKRCRNAIPTLYGPVGARPGSFYALTALSAVNDATILVPFVQGRSLAWQIEFGNSTARVLNANGTAAGITLVSPYTSAQLATLDWAQQDSTLWLFHPEVIPHRLQRLSSTVWVLSPAPFTQLPFAELGRVLSTTVTLSAATVGTGRTATASAASFLAGDVGRAIISAAGIAVITGYTSTTQVTVEITRAFASTAVPAGWTLEGSPQATCTPGAKDPVGATTTLTLDLAGWRTDDVGSVVRINGGLLRISGYTSATIVNAVILRELTATVAAAPLAWSLECPVWSAAFGYPRTGTIYQQRLICAGTTKQPRTVWGSRIGEQLDFERWTNDDDSFAFTIDSDDATSITYITAAQELVILTESGEYSMRGGVEKPITPTNVRIKPESNHGTAQVRPVQINRETMFVQRAGRKVRAFGYRYDFDGFSSPDITALAEHLTKPGIRWMAYCQEPDQQLWAAMTDGTLLTCTIDRDQQPSVIAWAAHATDGFVECVSVIPDGDRERVWAIVRRTVNGVQARYIERFDDTFEGVAGRVYGCTVDCGVAVDNPAGQTVFSVPHLAGREVDILADGAVQARKTVAADGSLTLGRKSYRTLIGLPRVQTEITLLTPEAQGPTGSIQGKAMRTATVHVDLLGTIGGKVEANGGQQDLVAARKFGMEVLDAPPDLITELVQITKLGWNKGFTEVTLIQDKPLPFILRSVVRSVQTGG